MTGVPGVRAPFATCPAASVALDVLVEAWNRAYDGYLVDVSRDARALADHVAAGSIDLARSLVALDGQEPVGLALLGVRPAAATADAADAPDARGTTGTPGTTDAGERAWVGGFGLAPSHRGWGLAVPLAAALLDVARGSGVTDVCLEVLTPNVAARRTYERVGFRIDRRLLVLGGRLAEPAERRAGRARVEPFEATGWAAARAALGRLAVASEQPWGREAVHARPRAGDLLVLAGPDAAPTAVVLVRPSATSASSASPAGQVDLSVVTGAALDEEAADAAVSALAAHHPRRECRVVNEPAASPFAAAFGRAGLAVVLDQHEMSVRL